MAANRSDFAILNKKLDKYSKIIEDHFAIKLDVNEEEKRRLSFYIYILEQVCQTSDYTLVAEHIVDTQFNRIVFGEGFDDYGIDVVYIDDDLLEMKLFNFKYRNKFNPDKKQSLNDNFTSTRFLNLAINGEDSDFKNINGKLKGLVEKANKILTCPQDEWKVELYQVSNEAIEEKETNEDLRRLAETYAIKIVSVALPTISEYMSIRPSPINAKMIVDSQALMSYSESDKGSAKSFIVRMKCSELLRVTSNSEDNRLNPNVEAPLDLTGVYLDFGVLFDNVRGLVKKSKYNENIAKTLRENPKKFFMYNNGVTMIARNIHSVELPGKKFVKLEISDFQVVNGGQTLRTIHDFNRQDPKNLENFLYDSEVLVRIFMPDSTSNEAHRIAEYTNSQNTIKPVDLKSLASEQIEIERYLDEHGIAYARKSGDTGPDDGKSYRHTISMETFGKILKANAGSPEKATNDLRNIFDSGYRTLFIDEFSIERAPKLIDSYFDIIEFYRKSKFRGNQLKYFYTLYYSGDSFNFSVAEVAEALEEKLEEYVKDNETTPVKALGSTAFKKLFELYMGISSSK
tara:strand:- start:2012 stop:3724 length:1713 start_codon:yes stop_codon:yes gene_type:complete